MPERAEALPFAVTIVREASARAPTCSSDEDQDPGGDERQVPEQQVDWLRAGAVQVDRQRAEDSRGCGRQRCRRG